MTAQTDARAVDTAVVEAIHALRLEQPGRAYDILVAAIEATLAAKDAEIAALKKEAADVVRPFAENAPPGNGEGSFELPDSHPITFRSDAPDTPSIVVGHFRAARSFLNKLERRDG